MIQAAYKTISNACLSIRKGWLYLKSIVGEFYSGYLHRIERAAGCTDYFPCEKHDPVLLIHGHTGSKTDFNALRRHLEKKEVGPIYVVQLKDHKDPIEKHALEVQQKVQEIAEKHQGSPIRFVGASRGALVGAYYAEYLSSDDQIQIDSIITLAAPIQGTKIVDLLHGAGLAPKDLCYLCDKLKKLHQQILQNEKTKYFHIASDTDFVVIPHHSATLGKYKEREYIVSGYSHNSLLYCQKVAEQVATWLKSA